MLPLYRKGGYCETTNNYSNDNPELTEQEARDKLISIVEEL